MILWDGRTRTAAAFSPETDGNPSEPVNLDSGARATRNRRGWIPKQARAGRSPGGQCPAPRKGQTLRWLPGVMVKWYAWSAEYPKTSLESSTRFQDSD